MIQPGEAQPDLLCFCLQHAGDRMLHVDRHVAQADDFGATVAAHRLRHDPRRIGKVEDKGVGCQRLHFARDLQHHRNGAQRFGESADACGFLAQQVIFQPQPLIRRPRRQLPDPQLGQDEFSAANGLIQAEMDADLNLFEAMALEHTLGQRGDNRHFLAPGFDIDQRQFRDRNLLMAKDNAFDKFRRIAAAAADDGNFQCLHSGLIFGVQIPAQGRSGFAK